jgi:hypothetical protein
MSDEEHTQDQQPTPSPVPDRPGRESLRVFIREENKKISDTIRKLEERIINLEKLIG